MLKWISIFSDTHTHTHFPRQDKFELISSRGQRVLSIFFSPTPYLSRCRPPGSIHSVLTRSGSTIFFFLSFLLNFPQLTSFRDIKRNSSRKNTEKEIVVFRRAVFLTAVARDSKWKHLLWKIYGRSLRIICSKRRVSQRLYVKAHGEHSSRAGENLQKFVVTNLS